MDGSAMPLDVSSQLQRPRLLHLHVSLKSALKQTRSSADADKPARRIYRSVKSPNIVQFHTLGIVSSCAIVTLSLSRAVFTIFDFKKCRDIKTRVRGHSSSLKVVPFDKLRMISY